VPFTEQDVRDAYFAYLVNREAKVAGISPSEYIASALLNYPVSEEYVTYTNCRYERGNAILNNDARLVFGKQTTDRWNGIEMKSDNPVIFVQLKSSDVDVWQEISLASIRRTVDVS
jgi:hypothetical protein